MISHRQTHFQNGPSVARFPIFLALSSKRRLFINWKHLEGLKVSSLHWPDWRLDSESRLRSDRPLCVPIGTAIQRLVSSGITPTIEAIASKRYTHKRWIVAWPQWANRGFAFVQQRIDSVNDSNRLERRGTHRKTGRQGTCVRKREQFRSVRKRDENLLENEETPRLRARYDRVIVSLLTMETMASSLLYLHGTSHWHGTSRQSKTRKNLNRYQHMDDIRALVRGKDTREKRGNRFGEERGDIYTYEIFINQKRKREREHYTRENKDRYTPGENCWII